MQDLLQPADEAELAAVIADAAAKRTPLAIEGGGTLRGLGRPMQTAATLSTARLTGVTLYEPAEMVLSARAGTPLAEVEALLAEQGPAARLRAARPSRLLRHRRRRRRSARSLRPISPARAASPAGAARDCLIGVRAVNGRGEIVKSGGRVMKNVTGLDLVKFLAGSYGTLAVMTEVTFKVLPAPETEATLAWSGLDDVRAIAALSAALGSPFSVTGAAHCAGDGRHCRPHAGAHRRVSPIRSAIGCAALRDALSAFGAPDRLDGDASAAGWKAMRDLAVLAASP